MLNLIWYCCPQLTAMPYPTRPWLQIFKYSEVCNQEKQERTTREDSIKLVFIMLSDARRLNSSTKMLLRFNDTEHKLEKWKKYTTDEDEYFGEPLYRDLNIRANEEHSLQIYFIYPDKKPKLWKDITLEEIEFINSQISS